MSESITVRPMRHDDIAFALTQTEREGWDIAEDGFEMHLRHDPDGCFVAAADGAPIGMVTTTRFGDAGFVGNLIVEPAFRRHGIGEALMRRALRRLQDHGARRIELEADAPGVRLYRRLGFVDRFESLRFRRQRRAEPAVTRRTNGRPITADDLGLISHLDRFCFGADRARLLAALIERSPGSYWVGDPDEPAGYVITQRLTGALRVGPCVARDADLFADLLEAILSRHDAPWYKLALPAENTAGVELLRRRGFEETTSSRRMMLGEGGYHDRPRQIFAIAGGDRG